MLRAALKLSVVAVCLLLFAKSLLAQEATGTIRGTVTDSFGSLFPEVKVTVRLKALTEGKKDIDLTRTTATDHEGKFSIAGLFPGVYELSADRIGMVYRNESVVVKPFELTDLEVRLTYEANCPADASGETLTATDLDKAEIVNQILVDALVRNRVPDYSLLVEQKGPIVISTEGIDAGRVKPISNFKFEYLKSAEIQNKADHGKDFLYLSFRDWKFGSNCAVVTLENGWAVGKNSRMFYLSGGGSIYLFQKESGKWTGKSVGGWIS